MADKLCDLCKQYDLETIATWDSKTVFGPHAFLCDDHYEMDGVLPSTKLKSGAPVREFDTKAFREWKREVNNVLMEICSMTSLDIGDADWTGMFENGMGAREAALEVLEEEGFPMEEID